MNTLMGFYFPYDIEIDFPAVSETKWRAHIKSRHNLKPIVRALNRLRCRWRPRESRHSLSGLSPQTTVLDESEEE